MILIVCAMDSEANELKKEINDLEAVQLTSQKFYYKGTLKKKEVILIVTGIGKSNAALFTGILLSKFKIEYIINIGLVGGLSPLKVGDKVVIRDASYHDVDATAFDFGYEYGQVPGQPNPFLSDSNLLNKAKFALAAEEVSLYTGDSFMTKKNNRFIGVFDMEGASVYQAANIFNTKIISVKLISDVIDSETQQEDYIRFEQTSGNTLKEMVLAIL
jgi:adenosylhomocysteine nucleosidase